MLSLRAACSCGWGRATLWSSALWCGNDLRLTTGKPGALCPDLPLRSAGGGTGVLVPKQRTLSLCRNRTEPMSSGVCSEGTGLVQPSSSNLSQRPPSRGLWFGLSAWSGWGDATPRRAASPARPRQPASPPARAHLLRRLRKPAMGNGAVPSDNPTRLTALGPEALSMHSPPLGTEWAARGGAVGRWAAHVRDCQARLSGRCG